MSRPAGDDVVVRGIAWRAVLAEAADRAAAGLAGLDFAEWSADRGQGADGTPSAGADLAAEDAALGYLAEAIPGVTLCSEEAGVSGDDASVLLIVDPVDGTNNAIRGIPYWAFSVAVVLDGEPVGAYVRNVPSGDEFFAWRGHGVTWRGAAAVPGTATTLRRATVALQRPAEPGALRAAQLVMARSRMVRILGAAALDLCSVACGAVDGYVNVNADLSYPFGEKVVDFAAAAIVIAEAGGVVTDAAGAPVPFAPDLAARVPVVAAATPELHAELLAAVAEGHAAGEE